MPSALPTPIASPHTPPGAAKLGMWLFLVALTMLFLASIAAYAVIRLSGRLSPATGTIEVPTLLWLSTVVILLSSLTLHHALACVQHEKQDHFKISLSVTLILALLFIALQIPALTELLSAHGRLKSGGAGTPPIHLYGMIFLLVLLHAAHLLGGVIPMAVILRKALKGRYDHEHYRPVQYLLMYWHFLDGVWVVMFVTFLALA